MQPANPKPQPNRRRADVNPAARRAALSRAVDWIEVARQADDDRERRHRALEQAVAAILTAAGR